MTNNKQTIKEIPELSGEEATKFAKEMLDMENNKQKKLKRKIRKSKIKLEKSINELKKVL